MKEIIKNLDQKINGVATQVSQLATWAQETVVFLNDLRSLIISNQLANQTMFDAVFATIPESKKLAIETLRLILEQGDRALANGDILDQQIQLTLKHLLLQFPPSPEERRKQFYLVEKDGKLQ